MMERTDRYCRLFHRLLSTETLLYSEMITTGAILFGDQERHLGFDSAEQPVALQLGGADPVALAYSAALGQSFGYAEINLNVGCPSDRVQSGRFGAALMADPALVGECVAAMQNVVQIPVTVKCRIGIDGQDSDEELDRFVATVSDAGCEVFIVHARKAILAGLSPKENREIPPLKYDMVYRLKEKRPGLEIILNGGVQTLEQASQHLDHVDGVMIGRSAYQNPYMLASADSEIFGAKTPVSSRLDILETFADIVADKIADGVPLKRMARHVVGLFQGEPGARVYRRYLAENAWKNDADADVLRRAADLIGPVTRNDANETVGAAPAPTA